MWRHVGSFGEANWIYRKSETGISSGIGQTGLALEPYILPVLGGTILRLTLHYG
jgi:hypothetical protein